MAWVVEQLEQVLAIATACDWATATAQMSVKKLEHQLDPKAKYTK